MQLPLGDLAFLYKGADFIGGWIAGKVLEAMLRTPLRRIKNIIAPETDKMKDYLYGISSGGLAPSSGINRWISMDDPKVYFGQTSFSNYPAPPYDLAGLNEVRHLLTGDWNSFVRQDDDKIVYPNSNLLLTGGRINSQLQTIRDELLPKLPLRFVNIYEIPRNFILPNRPELITRYFTDNQNNSYYKESSTNRILCNSLDKKSPPYGPFISSDGQLELDVILLTVLPAPNGKRAILVDPGHGAGSRMAELLFNHYILEELYKRLYKEAFPWFQAVFSVEVAYKGYHEIYGTPVLEHTIPLGNI